MSSHFTNEYIQVANEHRIRCLTSSLSIREMQIKIMISNDYTPIKTAIFFKTSKNIKCLSECEVTTLFTGGNVKNYNHSNTNELVFARVYGW